MAINYPEKIFLCHASEDSHKVMEIHWLLQKLGLSPWIDQKDIPPASEWDSVIRRTLKTASIVVIFLSSHLLNKPDGYVQKEIEIALGLLNGELSGQMQVITARLDDSNIPTILQGLKSVDLTEVGGEKQLTNLLKKSLNIFTDSRDGMMYKTVRIGNNIWFAENLRFTSENSWCYNNEERKAESNGRLYTWQEALESCPPGWHLPSHEEWNDLILNFGGFDLYDRYDLWERKSREAFSALTIGGRSGFDASLSGFRDSVGRFTDFSRGGFYWTCTQSDYSTSLLDFNHIDQWHVDRAYLKFSSFHVRTAWFYYFDTLRSQLVAYPAYQFRDPDPFPLKCGLSVRCLKNA